MYANSAYLNHSLVDFKDKSRPLIVGSCGTYHLYTKPRLPTYRPRGRIDFQLLYIASGKAYFHFGSEENETVVTAGHMVLYRPREMQKYEYYAIDQTEVYWVHFTGNDVTNLLRKYEIPIKEHIFYTGTSPEYQWIFRQMIQELQNCRENYQMLLTMLLGQIFIHINRQLKEGNKATSYMLEETERATRYFSENYNKPICIEEYAESRHVSACWFIRQFKHYTGMPPMQYILSIRIANAQNLLETTSYTVSEVASIIGYDNPLYFSRLFKKQLGMSPTEYRKRQAAVLEK